MKKILYILSFIFFGLFVVVNDGWCETITLTLSDFPSLTGAYSSGTISKSGVSFSYVDFIKSNSNIQVKATSGSLYNSTPIPGSITNISITHSGTARSTIICYGNTAQPTTNSISGSGSMNVSVTGDNRYFKITRGSNAAYWTQITITYTLSTSYTITAQSNNESYGTVSLSDKIITASPKSGYTYASPAYTVVSGTATVTQGTGANVNKFTVTPSSNCTIRINFKPLPKYTVNLNIAETLYSSVTQSEYGEEIDLSDSIPNILKACKLNGWQFVGWINTNDKNNRNLVTTITPTKDTTLYALFKTLEEGGENVVDTLSYEFIGNPVKNGTSQYYAFNDKTQTSNAIYSGKSSGGKSEESGPTIQLRSNKWSDNSYSGIITTNSGGNLHSIKIIWNNNNYISGDSIGRPLNSNRTLRIYTSNDILTSTSNLYENGREYYSLTYNKTNYIELDGKSYIGIRSDNNALYIDSIYITWSSIKYEYSTNPQCFETNISVAEWHEDYVEFNIGNYDSIHTYSGKMNSCDSIRIKITNDKNKDCIRWFQVPIFAGKTISKNDCNCDVVVLHDSTFTVSNNMANSNVYVYGTLIIDKNKTYTVNSLTLRRDNDSVPQLLYNGILDIKNGMFFEMRTDGEDWRWLTLPDSIRRKGILGKSEVLLKYYNGEIRANNGRGGWQFLQNDTTFGLGVIFGINDDRKMIYTFELDTSILTLEKERKKVYVKKFTPKSEPKNDMGWNLIGNPYMSTYNINPKFGTFIYSDTLVEEKVNGQWTGRWITEEKHLRYIVVPSNKKDQHIIDAGGYEQICLQNGYKLKPFTSFFVQANKDDSLIFYIKGHIEEASAPKRVVETNKNSETFLQINIGSIKTGCYISNKFNDSYEIGDDMESLYSTYQLINGYKLLYSAVNDSIVEHGIKFYTPTGNLYLDDKTNIEDFEEIYALYNGDWIDLLHGQTQDVIGEFILFAKRKNQETIPTNIDIIKDNNEVIKFMHNNNLYIKKNNYIYNILGGVIK